MGCSDEPALHAAATCISLILWGLYLSLFLRLMWVLRVRKVSFLSPPVIIIFVIFILNIGQTVILVFIAYRGFIRYPGGATAYFTLYDSMLIDQGWFAAMNFLQYPAGIAVNVIIIWRLFVICSRERRMIYFPMMLQCSGFMASVIIIRDDIIDVKQITHSSRFLNGYHDHRLALLAINITIMWYCTGLICYRLWSMEQQKRAIVAEPCQLGSELGSTNPYAKIIRALIRSGVLYCLSQVACLVCLAMQNDNGELILHELYIRVIGIVTVLIFLELDFRRVDEDPMAGQQLSPPDASTVSMPVFRVPTPVDSDVEVGIKPQPSRVDSDSTVAKVTEGRVGS